MNKHLLTVIISLSALVSQAQVVFFNGYGRSLVTKDNLSGNVLQRDTSVGQPKDSLSPRKSTQGYTVFDLGINAQPNENLRAHAILRLRNEFGGFYGDGSSFVFRQIKIDGIVNRYLKYEVGDLDLMMTQYTLYNFNESWHDYENDVFKIRRDVVAYENFNFGNKWRLQGLNLQSGILFNRGIEKINLQAFATRTKRTDFTGQPERFFMGGRINIRQSKNLMLGINYVQMQDFANTVPAANEFYNNTVLTGDIKASYSTTNLLFTLVGEYGNSSNTYRKLAADSVEKQGEWFYDVTAAVKYKPYNIQFSVGTRNVGADFRSPGAQTRRIFDAGTPNYFPTLSNGTAARVPVLLDRMGDETMRNIQLSNTLLVFLPQFGNITPYGMATPNRTGLTFTLSAGDIEKLYKAEVIYDMLSEVAGEGIADKRTFTGLRAGGFFNVHKLVKWNKMIVVNAGYKSENTSRGGTNTVSFNSAALDAGLTVEVFERFDLMFGYKSLTASGNEYIAVRDEFNRIVSYINYNDVKFGNNVSSFGARYRFSKNTFFSVSGLWNSVSFKESNENYKISQLYFNYTMIF